MVSSNQMPLTCTPFSSNQLLVIKQTSGSTLQTEQSAAPGQTFTTHLSGGIVEVRPACFTALLRSSGRGVGAVPRVGVGLGSGSLLWLRLHLFSWAIQAKPVTAACPHSNWKGKKYTLDMAQGATCQVKQGQIIQCTFKFPTINSLSGSVGKLKAYI